MASETYEFEVIGIFLPNKSNEIQANVLSNTLFVPESFIEAALAFHLNREHQAHQQMYDQESWWTNYEIEYHVLFQNQKASMPLFILKDCADWEKFKKEANQILFPYNQIESVTTREIYKVF